MHGKLSDARVAVESAVDVGADDERAARVDFLNRVGEAVARRALKARTEQAVDDDIEAGKGRGCEDIALLGAEAAGGPVVIQSVVREFVGHAEDDGRHAVVEQDAGKGVAVAAVVARAADDRDPARELHRVEDTLRGSAHQLL